MRMISEGSCDTEDWSNGVIQLYMPGIHFKIILIWKYIHIEKSYFKLQ